MSKLINSYSFWRSYLTVEFRSRFSYCGCEFDMETDVSLGRLCSNSLIANATTTSRNLTPAPRGCKIACKRVLFFDHGQAGYLTYLGSPISM